MTETPADDVLDRTADTDGPGSMAHAATEAAPQVDTPLEGESDGVGDAVARPELHGFARAGDWFRRAFQFFITQSSSRARLGTQCVP